MSILVFDIAQSFLSLNHQQTDSIHLEQFCFYLFQGWHRYESVICTFTYSLSSWYCVHFPYIWEKIKNLLTSIQVLILLFFNDWLFISQDKSYEKSNTNLFCSYDIISSLFSQFGLVIKHDKLKVFHFSRLAKKINLDLCSLKGLILYLKDIWCYLEFFFDKKLSFCQHIYYYANKALSTIKSMKMLGNFTRGLSLTHKQLFYRMCVLLIALYRFQL